MFGLISAGISLAGLGMSAVQAVKEGRRMKEAQAKSNAALQGYKNIQEQNALASLQAPDISSLQYDRTQRAMSQGIDALAQTGAEGAIGGVGNALQAGREADLETSMQQGQLNADTQLLKKREQARINEAAVGRQADVYGYQLGNATQQYNDAQANQTAAISGMVGQLGSAVGFAKEDFDPATGMYKYKKTGNGSGVNKDSFSSVYGAPKPNYTGSVSGNYGTPVNMEGLSGGYNWGGL
jgi:hypothetical protein